MKKLCLLLLLFIFPICVNAASGSIRNAYITGTDTANVGGEFSQGFMVNFSDIKKGTNETYGIWLVGFEIVYDEDALVIEGISSDGGVWASTVYRENGKTYVLSQFSKDPYHNGCVDGVLYCADYGVSIKFYVKDTTKASTTIKMKDVEAGVFQVSGGLNPEYNVSDMIELKYSSESSSTIKINKPANAVVNEPKSIISNKPKTNKPSTTSKKTTTNNKTTTSKIKSTNNILKSLVVGGYPFEFSKDKKEYTIYVPDGVKLLDVEAKPEDAKATVEIIGANDLSKNDGKVIINVKAENGNINTYTINIEKEVAEKEIEGNKLNIHLTKKQITIGGLVIVSLLLIIIIKAIINHIGNRRIDKSMDSF